ncbi:MAG: hypothetical protein AABZ31_13830 [Bdellovibrionota bacterium]
MVYKLIYDLPRHPDHLIEIIKTLPKNWDCLDGFLLAPFPLYNQGKIAERTRLVIGVEWNSRATIIGADDVPFEQESVQREPEDDLYEPNILEVLQNKKGFSSIHFDRAGLTPQKFPEVCTLAISFLEQGYKGELVAYRNYEKINDQETICSERFSFSHITRSLELAYDPEHAGREHNILRIQHKIESYGLHERQPNLLPFRRARSG